MADKDMTERDVLAASFPSFCCYFDMLIPHIAIVSKRDNDGEDGHYLWPAKHVP